MRQLSSLLAATLVAASWAQATPDLVIGNVRLVVGDGSTIALGAVRIRDGKIVEVGENLTPPADAVSIDGKGGVLYPGFIDAYTTRGLKPPAQPEGESAPDARNTAPTSMWHGNRKGIRSDILASTCLDLAGEIKDNYAQGITTALIAPASGTIRGLGAVVDYSGKGETLIPVAAAAMSVRGGGFGGGGGGYPGSLLGIIALERQVLIDAQEYAAYPPEKADPYLENLKALVTGQIPAIVASDTERDIVRAGKIASEFGLRLIIAGGRDAYRVVDSLKSSGAAVFVSLDLGDEPSVKPSADSDVPVGILQERHDLWRERTQNIKTLIAAGIPVAFSSNGGSLSEYLKNVRAVIGTGVSESDAVKAMTSGAATLLGIADRTGSIQIGKEANLVLMTESLAKPDSKVRFVVVRGQKIDVAEAGK